MDGFLLYLILKLDTIRTFLTSIFVILIFILLCILVFDDDSNKKTEENENKTIKEKEVTTKILKILSLTTVIILFLTMAIPSTKQGFILYFGPKITKSEIFIKTPDKIDKILDLYINKLKENKNK